MQPQRILLLLGQMPQDPASGAARSCKTICEYLAASGQFTVRALATTATEKALENNAERYLQDLGLLVERRAAADRDEAPELHFTDKEITYTLLESPNMRENEREMRHGRRFDRLFDQMLADFQPHLIFTFGGHPDMIRRWLRARQRGIRIVFGLRNQGYLNAGPLFRQVDAVLTPSRFLSSTYRRQLGLQSTPLPTPIDMQDVVAPSREPIFVTYVNPSLEKGVMFMARFAEQLAKQRPDIPLLVVESRGTAGTLVAAGLKGGFDLRHHRSIMVSPGVGFPREIFAVTRVLLAPSVCEEASGRIVSEALVNGVPPIVSNRGGLPEECRGAGLVFPLPDDLTTATRIPVTAQATQPWIDAVTRLVDDDAYYQAECKRAERAGKAYRTKALQDQYVSFFKRVLRKA